MPQPPPRRLREVLDHRRVEGRLPHSPGSEPSPLGQHRAGAPRHPTEADRLSRRHDRCAASSLRTETPDGGPFTTGEIARPSAMQVTGKTTT